MHVSVCKEIQKYFWGSTWSLWEVTETEQALSSHLLLPVSTIISISRLCFRVKGAERHLDWPALGALSLALPCTPPPPTSLSPALHPLPPHSPLHPTPPTSLSSAPHPMVPQRHWCLNSKIPKWQLLSIKISCSENSKEVFWAAKRQSLFYFLSK